MKEIVKDMAERPRAYDLDKYGVEEVNLHYDPAAHEIMLVLIKYKGIPGWRWEPSPHFDWVRAEEIGLHIEDTDAHRPLVGHLISTEAEPSDRPKHQRSEQSTKQRK